MGVFKKIFGGKAKENPLENSPIVAPAIVFRRVTPDDIHLLRIFTQELFDYELDAYDETLDETFPETNDEYYQNVIQNDDYLGLVCEIQGAPVAYLTAHFDATSPYRNASFAVVDNVYVDEDHREQGIAQKLFEEAEDWAVSKGADIFSVSCYAYNTAAVTFYEKNGFDDHILTLEKKLK